VDTRIAPQRDAVDVDISFDHDDARQAPLAVTPAWMGWPPPPAERRIDWPRVGATVFLCGSAVAVVWLGLGHLLVWRMIRRSAAAPAWVSATVREVLPHGATEPHVRVVAHLTRPASLGIWRPVILLPHGLVREESAARVRQVILHELGHVMRRDALGNALFNLAMPLLWFHPLYWWLRSQSSLSRERVADDWAAAFDGKEAYVAELVELARSRLGALEKLGSAGPAGVIGIFGRGSHFYRRMQMLLQNEKPLAVRCSSAWRACVASVVMCAVAVGAGFVGVRPVRAQDQPAPPGQPTTPPPALNPFAPAEQPATVTPPAAVAAAEPGGDEEDRDDDNTPRTGDARASAYAARKQDVDLRREIRALERQRDELARDLSKLESELRAKPNKADAEARFKELQDQRAEVLKNRSDVETRLASVKSKVSAMQATYQALQSRPTVTAPYPAQSTAKHPGTLSERGYLPGSAATPGYAAQNKPAPPGAIPAPMESGYGRAAVQNPARDAGSFAVGGGAQLDLVNLANSVADAAGAVGIARAQAETVIADNEGKWRAERATAEAKLEAAKRRLDLLRGLARLALEGAARDLDRYQRLADQKVVSAEELGERQGKVQMLKLIVSLAEEARTDDAKPRR
jgi:hypothetical protein